MPMPHRTFAQVAKRRLTGKEGRERIREVNALLGELPDYRNGPYADLRKWLLSEIDGHAGPVERGPPRFDRGAARGRGPDRARRAAQRRQVVAAPGAVRDPDQDRRLPVHDAPAGAGADPDRGRASSSWSRSRVSSAGAGEDRGGGRALLGVLRTVDAIVYCCRRGRRPRASCGPSSPRSQLAGIDKPAILAATRADEAADGAVDRLTGAVPGSRRRRGVGPRRGVARCVPRRRSGR